MGFFASGAPQVPSSCRFTGVAGPYALCPGVKDQAPGDGTAPVGMMVKMKSRGRPGGEPVE